MTVSVIIPNYNGAVLLKTNLPKVIAVCQKHHVVIEILVADDSSTDDSLTVLKTLPVKVITGQKQLGFAGNVNRAARLAKGDILILLNTDVYPEENFLAPLLRHFADPTVFAVGMLDKSLENGRTVLRGRGEAFWRRGFYIHRRGEVDRNDTAWVSGGSGAFRKDLFLKLGGFDTIYNPFYWEDIDLSYRALKQGYRLVFEPQSRVIHRHEEGTIKRLYNKETVRRIAYRNQFLFIWRQADRGQKVVHFAYLPLALVKAFLRGDLAFPAGLVSAVGRFFLR